MTSAGQFGPYPFIDSRGNALPGVEILIYDPTGTTLASLYANRTRTPLSNPIPTGVADGVAGVDTAGNAIFWADADEYLMVVRYGGTQRYQAPITISADPDDANAVLSVNGRSGIVIGLAEQADLATEISDRQTQDALLIPLAQKGAASGVATLDSGSKVPTAQLPALAITETFVVASQAAMLALAAQRGDVAIRTDLNKSFVLSTDSPATLADWKELLTPTDSVLSVNTRTGAVSGLAEADASNVAASAAAWRTAIDAQQAGTYLTPANIEDAITDGETSKAPTGNAVFDALLGLVPVQGSVAGRNAKFASTEISNEISSSYMALRNWLYTGDTGTRIHIEPRAAGPVGGLLKIFGDKFESPGGITQPYRDFVLGFLQAQQGDQGQHGTGAFWVEAKTNDGGVPNFGYLGRSPDMGFAFQDGLYIGGRFVRLPTCHVVGTTNGSATVTDPLIVASDRGRRIETIGVLGGTGIPVDSYVGTVTPGVGFLLSSSATSQVNVLATATQTTTAQIGLPISRATFVIGEGHANISQTTTAVVGEVQGDLGFCGPDVPIQILDGVTTNGSTTVTSASWNLTADDFAKFLYANSAIPVGARVAAINSPTSMEMTLPATADTTGLDITMGLVETAIRWYNNAGLARNVISMYGGGMTVKPDGDQALNAKKGGSVAIGPENALATNATAGFLELPTTAGIPTGTATPDTGKAPLVVDTTNHRPWYFDGAAWTPLIVAGAFDVAGVRVPDSTSGAWTWTNIAVAYGGFLASAAAQNNLVVYAFDQPLREGTWAVTYVHSQTSGAGIATIEVSVDGTNWSALDTLDTYAGVTTNGVVTAHTGLTVPAGGVRFIRFKMATKNASSSAYLLRLSGFSGRRTGA